MNALGPAHSNRQTHDARSSGATGVGTLSIGTTHYSGTEYRIFVREVDGREQAICVIVGSDEALWEAFNTDGVRLALEDGRLVRIALGLLAEGRADIRVIGPISTTE